MRHDAVVDPLHQRRRRGDLEQRRVLDLQRVGQGRHDDVRQRFAGACTARRQGLHQRFGNVTG